VLRLPALLCEGTGSLAMSTDDSYRGHLGALGEFIRAQRRLANLSLRDLAERTKVSNPYLSQIERGLHEPSARVLKAIATALDLSAETLLLQAGLFDGDPNPAEGQVGSAAAAIRADVHLTDEQKQALLAVYHSYTAANRTQGDDGAAANGFPGDPAAENPDPPDAPHSGT
jgi:transcriptional regulator with XRE-family HTH domain